jgi:mRNA interferase MazF
MTLKRGDVVLLPFPFSDLTTSKQRPAVVLSSTIFNHSHHDVIVVAITSQLATQQSSDVKLTDEDVEQGGLLKPSIVKPAKIVTIDQRLIRKTIGSFTDATINKIQSRIKILLID